jgi:hypothetical protein
VTKTTILLAAFVHAERLQHFSGSSETNRLALLPNGKRGQVNRDNTILPEWQTVIRMPGDLQNEVAVPPFVKHLVLRRFPHWQTTKYERPRTESQVLFSFLALQPNHATAFGLSELLFRDQKLRHH